MPGQETELEFIKNNNSFSITKEDMKFTKEGLCLVYIEYEDYSLGEYHDRFESVPFVDDHEEDYGDDNYEEEY